MLGLGGKPDHQRRAPVFQLRDRRENVGVFHQLQRRHAGGGLFQLLLAFIGDAPVGNCRREDCDIGRQGGLHPVQHVARRFHPDHRDARRIAQFNRAGDQRDVGACGLCGGGDGKALLAGGAVGDIAHGIDRLMRWPRRDQHTLARERPRLRRTQDVDGGSSDFDRLRHPPDAGLARLGHFAGIGADHVDAVAPKLQHVAARGGVVPHQGVHGRGQQDRAVGGQQDCAGEIVGVALRHLRHQVGGRRRHHDQIAFAGKADMAGVKLALGVEQIRVDALMRQRAGGKRRDELLCGLGQHAADMNVPLL